VRLDGEVDWWGWLAKFVAEISRREHSKAQTIKGANIQRTEQSKAQTFKGPDIQKPEQSKARTVKGTNIQRVSKASFIFSLINQLCQLR